MSEGRTRYPDGLHADHERARPWRKAMNWIGIFILLALLAVAMTGVLGGGKRPVTTVERPIADLRVKTPATLRSGMFFETDIEVRAREAIAKPVLAVSESYWRDITINTTQPAATSETSEQGMFLFEYEPMAPGDVLKIKFDGQLNPSLFGGTAGRFELRDDERVIAAIPAELTVMP